MRIACISPHKVSILYQKRREAATTFGGVTVNGAMTVSVKEAAQEPGVGVRAMYSAVRDGRVPALRVGTKPRLRIPRRAIERLLEEPERFAPENATEIDKEA